MKRGRAAGNIGLALPNRVSVIPFQNIAVGTSLQHSDLRAVGSAKFQT